MESNGKQDERRVEGVTMQDRKEPRGKENMQVQASKTQGQMIRIERNCDLNSDFDVGY